MKSKTPAFALALAVGAHALSLHQGNSWTWMVVDRANDSTDWRTATLIDSGRHDSGRVWTLRVRDSSLHEEDTALILEREDRSQSWIAPSKWIPWDPNPPTRSDWLTWDSGLGRSPAATPLPWGARLLNAYECDLFYGRTYTGIPVGCRTAKPFEVKVDNSLPSLMWYDSLGFLGARSIRGWDWALQEMNRRPRTFAGRLSIPAPGTVTVWEKTVTRSSWRICQVVGACPPGNGSDSTRILERWRILSVTDSSGYKRIEIERTMDSAVDSTWVDSLAVIANPRTGAISPMLPQTEGWWIFCDDTSSGDGFMRSQWKYATQPGAYENSDTSTGWFSSEGVLENYSMKLSRRTMNDASFQGVRMRRLDPSSIRSRPSAGTVSLAIRSLAALHPTLPVRWRDLRGRSGRIPASLLAQERPEGGVLFLDATLPDGSHWRGTLLPTR